MCQVCKKDWGFIEIKIKDKNGEKTYCPNCLLLKIYESQITLENDKNLICDVTHKAGAVLYETFDESYVLDKNIMERLIRHDLKPDEYKSLTEKYGYKYMLHDDFYTTDGIAIQPAI